VSGFPVPLDVLRLRSATRAYLAVLEAALPAVDALAERGAELALCMDQALAREVAGSPARIAVLLARLLGED
jgi:hypothetical protein